MEPWLDTRRAPFVTFTFPATYTYEELDAQFCFLEDYYRGAATKTTGPIGLLVDATAVTQSSARNRKRIADAVGFVAEILKERAVGQAYAIASPIARGGLTALLWIRQPPWPVKLFATRQEAEAWLAERFAEAGLTVQRPA